MKFTNQPSVCFGIKESAGEFDGKAYSSTTFYLPADMAKSGSGRAIGSVTTPHKFGDATEFKKWEHLEHSFPAGGLPVLCDFDVVAGRDANGKDQAKLVLVGIKPAPAPAGVKG
jgi:hypothetical protein